MADRVSEAEKKGNVQGCIWSSSSRLYRWLHEEGCQGYFPIEWSFNQEDPLGEGRLRFAADVVKFLQEKGVDVQWKGGKGHSIMVKFSPDDIVQLLEMCEVETETETDSDE